MRDEVVRQRIDDCDADGGVGDMLHDYHEAHFVEGPQEEETEGTAKAYYEMLEAAQKQLHSQTKVSQLDGIERLMANYLSQAMKTTTMTGSSFKKRG